MTNTAIDLSAPRCTRCGNLRSLHGGSDLCASCRAERVARLKSTPRPRIERLGQLGARAREHLRVLHADDLAFHGSLQRPRTYADCLPGGFNAERPCPWVGCRHHLALEANGNGSVLIAHPDTDVAEIQHSCSLDIAARGGHTLEDVGEVMNLTRERVRQIEARALRKCRRAGVQLEDGVVKADPTIERSVQR